MKKNLLFYFIYFFTLFLINSCSSSIQESSREKKPLPGKIQFFTSGLQPEWTKETMKIASFEGRKIFYYVVMGEEKTVDLAKEKADSQKEGILKKAFAKTNLDKIIPILDSLDSKNDSFKTVLSNAFETVSFSKEELTEFKKISIWWEHFSEPNIDKDQVAGWAPPSVKYYSRFACFFDFYKTLRNNLFLKIKKELNADSQAQKLIDEIMKKLQEQEELQSQND